MEDQQPINVPRKPNRAQLSCFQQTCLTNFFYDQRFQTIRQTACERHSACCILPILLIFFGGSIYGLTVLTGYLYEAALIEDPLLREPSLWLGKGFILICLGLICFYSVALCAALIYARFFRKPS
jgi:hypothetical protein